MQMGSYAGEAERALYNIAGTSNTVQKAGYTPRVNRDTGRQIGPFVGEVVSEWMAGTLMDAIRRRAQLAREHRSSDFEFYRVAR